MKSLLYGDDGSDNDGQVYTCRGGSSKPGEGEPGEHPDGMENPSSPEEGDVITIFKVPKRIRQTDGLPIPFNPTDVEHLKNFTRCDQDHENSSRGRQRGSGSCQRGKRPLPQSGHPYCGHPRGPTRMACGGDQPAVPQYGGPLPLPHCCLDRPRAGRALPRYGHGTPQQGARPRRPALPQRRRC